MRRDLPSGRVTFAFTDVVGSTRAFVEHGDQYVAALQEMHERISRHARQFGGVVVETEGDGAFLAFPTADAAVDALRALQSGLKEEPTQPVRLMLRAGAHTGTAVPAGDGYVALPVHVAARVAGAARAGQVLVSAATQAELAEPVGDAVGIYVLKDVPEPVTLWSVFGEPLTPRATPARKTNIRPSRTTFTGRDIELAELAAAVGDRRLVTLVGPGGAGKSRLVSEWALSRAESEQAGGGAWMAELATIDSPEQVVPTIAQACGTVAADGAVLVGELATREPFVLVLDNCEHLIDGVVPVVEQLLDGCPGVRIVCTSREPLAVQGETVRRVGALSDDGAAAALFAERAAAAGAPAEVLATEAVQEICDAVDGLPLAIELAALHAATTPLAQLLDVIRDETTSLGRRGGEERQRSLDAILQWSVRHLPEGELHSLLALSLWPGRFDPGMAAKQLADVPAAPAGADRILTRKNLVDLDGQEYRLLFTIRGNARRRLAELPDLERSARSGVVAWAVEFARGFFGRDANYQGVSVDQATAIDLAVSYERAQPVEDIYLVWDMARHIARARHATPQLRAEAVASLSSGPPNDLRSALVHGVALNILSAFAHPVRLPDDHLEAIVGTAREGGASGVALLQTLGAVAWELELTGRADLARLLRLEYAATVDADPTCAWLRPAARHGLGNNLRAMERWSEAASVLEDGIRIGAEQGTVASMNVLHLDLAEVLLRIGRPQEALRHGLEAARLLPQPGTGRNVALRLVTTAYWDLGDDEAALAVGRELVATLQKLAGDPHYRAELESLLAGVPVLAELG